MPTAQIWELQQSLSTLAGHPNAPWLEAQQAANVYAGTTQMELLMALNCRYYGVSYWPIPSALGPALDLNQVANALAGTVGKEAQDALSGLAGGGHT